MKDWKKIFKDDNDWNEKSIIGFVAFMVLLVILFIDVVFTVGGDSFDVNELVYDTLLFIILGCFGISGIQKFSKNNLLRHYWRDILQNIIAKTKLQIILIINLVRLPHRSLPACPPRQARHDGIRLRAVSDKCGHSPV